MEAESWDDRYSATELVWTATPNVFVAEVLADAPPGRAVDVAAGEGRHAVWLATLGWQVTAVDFSAVGLERATAWAEAKGVAERLTTVVSDVLDYRPEPDAYDVALFAYLQVPASARRTTITQVAEGVAVGGLLVVVAHDSSNLALGHGGPPNAEVLYTPEDVVADLAEAAGEWEVTRAEVAEREVPGAPRPARDAVVVATRTR